MIRIVVTGAESTGKSTLARALARHFKVPLSSEYVRPYVDGIGRELTADDLEPIARGQFAAEDAAVAQAESLVIHDTNILSSILYAKHYFGRTLDWVDKAFAERDYTLYLLCLPDIPWEPDDGQRESPEARDQLHAMFKAELVSLKLPYIEIGGAHEQRLAQAIAAIAG